MDTAYSAQKWSELFVAAAGASAALAGLVFVAVSINLERILAEKGVPERALETLMLLIAVTVVSFVGLIPQSRVALGAEVLGLSLVASAGMVPLVRKTLPRRGSPVGWLIGRVVLMVLGVAPFVVAGASLLAEAGGGLYWVAGGIVAATFGGVANAWVLLVEILR